MKVSEFRRAVEEEFGEAQGRVLVNQLVIDDLGGRTAARALDDGVPIGRVWLALCRANDVPESRRHGRGLPARSR
jgi:hypothetical protein